MRPTGMPIAAVAFAISLAGANPDLVPGVWKNLTPAAANVNPAEHVFCQGMAIDPQAPSTLYLGICGYDVSKNVGLYKSTDAGSTWNRVGNLDEPVHVAVDPADSKHLYVVDGVRGNTIGFWISHDGGETWTKPDGFTKITANPVGTQDLYSIATEPGNFNHVLVSFHSPWNGATNAGVLESMDGGLTWAARNPPAGSANGYGMAIFFLDFPRIKQGDAKTWLFTAQQGGFFRTTDGGATWAQVHDKQMTHGGNQIYCARNGVLYSGGYQYPARSTDNGASWTQIKTGLDYSWYMGVAGDGTNIYIGPNGPDRPMFVSPETDGLTWKPYQGGTQTFPQEPFEMAYDSANGIMYSANWAGLYALKVLVKDNAVREQPTARHVGGSALVLGRNGIEIRDPAGRRYSLPGKRLFSRGK